MQDAAGSEIISKLTSLLRKHGDHVTNGDSKLCLTGSSLIYLNSCFNHLKFGTQSNTSASDDHASISFLLEFLQKTLSLKLVPGTCSRFDTLVNISCFRSLQYLEIKKVPLGYITGLQSLRSQLRGLTCIRSVIALNEVFVSCGGDLSSTPFSWGALKEANLSYNGIENLDDSLKVLPTLEVLNLSHNSIDLSDSEDYLQFLNDLRYLNLGYNQLEHVPCIHSTSTDFIHLTTVILKNNDLHNLEGIQHFNKLRTLDVSNNCIAAFDELYPLANLEKLINLCLDGNPVCFHSDYRLFTVACLSPIQRSEHINIDGKLLTVLEQSFVGSNVQPASMLSYIPPEPLGKPRNLAFVNTPEDVMESSQDFSDGIISTSTGNRKRGGKGRKKRRARQISLTDAADDSPSTSGAETSANLETALEHSADIQRLEKARHLGGNYWLPAISHVVHGDSQTDNELPQPPQAEPPQDELDGSSVPLSDDMAPDDDERDGGRVVDIEEGRARSVSSSSVESKQSDDEVDEPFLVMLKTPGSDENHEDENKTYLLVSVTKHFIRERDVKGKVSCKLETGSLLSAELEKTEDEELVIHLKFDYLSRERKERHYIMEDDSNCQQLMELLLPIVYANTEMTKACDVIDHLECLKCSAEFTTSSKSRDEPVCPDCGSTRIIQIEPTDKSADIPYSRDKLHDSPPRDSPRGWNGPNLNDSSIRTIDSDMSVTVLVPFSSSDATNNSRADEKKHGNSWPVQSPSDSSPYSSTPVDTPRFQSSRQESPTVSEKIYETKTFTLQNKDEFSVNDREGVYVTKTSPPVRTSEGVYVTKTSPPVRRTSALSNSLQSSSDEVLNGERRTQPLSKRVVDSPVTLKTSSRVTPSSSIPSSADSSLTKEKQPADGSPRTAANLQRISRSMSPNPNIIKSLFTKLSGKMSGVSSSLSSSQGSSSSELQVAHNVEEVPPRLGFKLSSDEFRRFDHRLQLYCEVSLFHEGETCACLLKAPVIVYGSTKEISGLMIVSNKAVYICTLMEAGCGSPDECLSLVVTYSLDKLRYIDYGLQSQSFRLEFDSDCPGCYTFNVRDRDRCEEFLHIFIDCVEAFNGDLDTRPLMITRTHPQTLAHIRSQVFGILEEDANMMGDRFQEQVTRFTEPPLIKDRKSLLRNYARCFVGKEFVDWLLRFGEAESRSEAVALGQRLLDAGVVEHVSKETKFEDKDQFYKFAQHEQSDTKENGQEHYHESLPDIDCHVTAAVMAYKPQDQAEPNENLDAVSIVVTRTHIALVKENPQWPFPRYLDPAPSLEGPQFECFAKYRMTDITAVEFFEDSPCFVGICISEEESDSLDVYWLLKTETVSSLSFLLKAIKKPWETQFGVELQTTLHPTLGD